MKGCAAAVVKAVSGGCGSRGRLSKRAGAAGLPPPARRWSRTPEGLTTQSHLRSLSVAFQFHSSFIPVANSVANPVANSPFLIICNETSDGTVLRTI